MSRLIPVSHREFIRRLRALGFAGPFSGGKHLYVTRQGRAYHVPNPHRGDISAGLLKKLLKQLEITLEQWQAAG